MLCNVKSTNENKWRCKTHSQWKYSLKKSYNFFSVNQHMQTKITFAATSHTPLKAQLIVWLFLLFSSFYFFFIIFFFDFFYFSFNSFPFHTFTSPFFFFYLFFLQIYNNKNNKKNATNNNNRFWYFFCLYFGFFLFVIN